MRVPQLVPLVHKLPQQLRADGSDDHPRQGNSALPAGSGTRPDGESAAQRYPATASEGVDGTTQHHQHRYYLTAENQERVLVAFNELEKG